MVEAVDPVSIWARGAYEIGKGFAGRVFGAHGDGDVAGGRASKVTLPSGEVVTPGRHEPQPRAIENRRAEMRARFGLGDLIPFPETPPATPTQPPVTPPAGATVYSTSDYPIGPNPEQWREAFEQLQAELFEQFGDSIYGGGADPRPKPPPRRTRRNPKRTAPPPRPSPRIPRVPLPKEPPPMKFPRVPRVFPLWPVLAYEAGKYLGDEIAKRYEREARAATAAAERAEREYIRAYERREEWLYDQEQAAMARLPDPKLISSSAPTSAPPMLGEISATSIPKSAVSMPKPLPPEIIAPTMPAPAPPRLPTPARSLRLPPWLRPSLLPWWPSTVSPAPRAMPRAMPAPVKPTPLQQPLNPPLTGSATESDPEADRCREAARRRRETCKRVWREVRVPVRYRKERRLVCDRRTRRSPRPGTRKLLQFPIFSQG